MIESSYGNSAIGTHRAQRMGESDGIGGIAVKTQRIDVEMKASPIDRRNGAFMQQ